MDTHKLLEQRQRLLHYSEETIRMWNWPLVTSGDITAEDLDEEVKNRTDMLASMTVEMIAVCLLNSLPDDMFYEA